MVLYDYLNFQTIPIIFQSLRISLLNTINFLLKTINFLLNIAQEGPKHVIPNHNFSLNGEAEVMINTPTLIHIDLKLTH